MDVDVRGVKRGIRHTQMCWQGGVCVNLKVDDDASVPDLVMARLTYQCEFEMHSLLPLQRTKHSADFALTQSSVCRQLIDCRSSVPYVVLLSIPGRNHPLPLKAHKRERSNADEQ